MAPLSHFPPEIAGSERSSLPFVCCALGSTPPAQNHGDMERRSPTGIAWSAGLRPASRGSAKPAPMTVRRTDVSGAPPAQSGLRCSLRFAQRCRQRSAFPCLCVACAQSGLRCSLRFAQRCRPEVGVPLPARRLCSIGIAPSARLRRAVPTRGRRSLACAPPSPWGHPPRCVARRLASRSEGERGRWPPFHTFPPKSRAANGVRCHLFVARSAVRHPRRITGT